MVGDLFNELNVQSEKPYSDILKVDHPGSPDDNKRCEKCGSPHRTLFQNLIRNEDSRGFISGDLSVKTIVVMKCLSCGHSAPVEFNLVREM